MKQFTMSMFAKEEHLMQAKIAYYERLLQDHKKVFTWVRDNPGCHPENIRAELIKLLKELDD